MGVLPLQFDEGDGWQALGLKGDETITIRGLEGDIRPRQTFTVEIASPSGASTSVQVLGRIDTLEELDYFPATAASFRTCCGTGQDSVIGLTGSLLATGACIGDNLMHEPFVDRSPPGPARFPPARVLPLLPRRFGLRPAIRSWWNCFTSQGCSSCPEADAFLAELAQRPGVIALSYHVDYWDYLGWRDNAGLGEFSRRQQDYAVRRGDGRVYTPQMCHQRNAGRGGFAPLGRRGAHHAATRPRLRPDGSPEPLGQPRRARHRSRPPARMYASRLGLIAAVEPQVTVEITRGENAGRQMVYHNVVRRLVPAGRLGRERRRQSSCPARPCWRRRPPRAPCCCRPTTPARSSPRGGGRILHRSRSRWLWGLPSTRHSPIIHDRSKTINR